MITRAGNATKRPGEVQINSSVRRPKQVVQAERAAKAAEKEKAATEKSAAIQKLAQLEHNARKNLASKRSGGKAVSQASTGAQKIVSAEGDNDSEAKSEPGTTPPDSEDQPEAASHEGEYLLFPSYIKAYHRAQSADGAVDDDLPHDDAQSLPLEEPDPLYADGKTGPDGKPASTAYSNEDMDAEEEEEAPAPNVKKQGNKNPKKGLDVRDRINAAATELASKEHPDKKRKGASGTNAGHS
jgi:hypothetical protein